MSLNIGSNDAKRQAMTGQWRTPPTPAFAQQQQHQMPPPHPVPQHLQSHHPTNPQQQQQQHHQHQHHQHQQHQHQQHQHSHQIQGITPSQAPSTTVTLSSIPSNNLEDVPLPESSDDYAKALQEAYRRGAEAAARLQQQNISTAASCPDLQKYKSQQPVEEPTVPPNVVVVPNALAAAAPPPPPPPPQPPAHHPQPPPGPGPGPVQANVATTTSRSLSLPDMQSYAVRAQAEEEKRKKRLARNRASARLRRLRKKNLVDSYEGEVGVLESALEKLKSHTWGTNHEALLEALSMERGQQELTNEERVNLIKEIITQQLEQLAFLRETQLEQQTLLNVVENPDHELSVELQAILNLNQAQKDDIRAACHGLDKEVEAMETFISCLEAMQSRDWFWNEGVTQITNQFTSILHSNQLSKFLLWTDANAEALDSLEFCEAPPAQAPPQGMPIFIFGMDDHTHSGQNAGGADEGP